MVSTHPMDLVMVCFLHILISPIGFNNPMRSSLADKRATDDALRFFITDRCFLASLRRPVMACGSFGAGKHRRWCRFKASFSVLILTVHQEHRCVGSRWHSSLKNPTSTLSQSPGRRRRRCCWSEPEWYIWTVGRTFPGPEVAPIVAIRSSNSFVERVRCLCVGEWKHKELLWGGGGVTRWDFIWMSE